MPTRTGARVKLDTVTAQAVDQARSAAESYAKDFGVGEHLGVVADDDRCVTHLFACEHPGYRGWRWAVSMARAVRGRVATVNEVELLPGEGSLVAPSWIPWENRVQAGDIAPGMLMPTEDNDPRLEPGFTGGELAADAEPAEWAMTRAVVSELGLGRERVLTRFGRDLAIERWLEGEGGPDTALAHQAPAPCATCGYFARLQGSLGMSFGVCTNEFSPSDGRAVSLDHGCGGHSDVAAEERGIELPEPVFNTIETDQILFD
ncbi:DUF3027 domain-containing protein [Aestuariimicrobium sp. p3-SID1156]|uniref:DUF3027 domain-containing protein n=1 Tax=Aestuariimicrobium sp. p3-SID1156 TaxID=2916038 RepID=UPI00223BB263|nr:DUF3027 domain-containing protein [Aestuariimicrobium sp. p3-SID1156]MCT1458441.1 DUF3027 domain-containing protein [Aestuariimicrobium sp. p3-SID1156]